MVVIISVFFIPVPTNMPHAIILLRGKKKGTDGNGRREGRVVSPGMEMEMD